MKYLMGQDPSYPFYSGANFNSMHLNQVSPFGAFISHSGNKYIVTEDFGTKIAIVLKHDSIPQFSWIPLGKKTVERANWQGPFWLSATHAAIHQGVYAPGIIEVGDGFAGLDCTAPSGDLNSINLGYAGPRGSHFCEYDGWEVHTLACSRLFFKRRGTSTYRRVAHNSSRRRLSAPPG